eukprot:TRINITY_DN3519_c0_g1_i1.p1 TRINITY_DN3519_c0_g1~~TRINITY_DN3519_c0_g1_i1.p1  ORF type:complete len:331 (+),score=57.46 TRINITY_DN3519_c0_g1_i1:17-1009(+)
MASAINCTEFPDLCESRRTLVTWIMGVVGILSFLGSFSIFFTIFYFKLADKLKNRMIMYLCISDMCQAVATTSILVWTGKPAEFGVFCTIQGAVFNFANVSSALWYTNVCLYVTIYIISTVTFGTKNLPGKMYELLSNLIWVFCFFLTMVGFTYNNEESPFFYGPVGGGVWCWIVPPYLEERMTLHYLWIFIALGIVVLLTLINFLYLCCNAGTFGKDIDKKIGSLMLSLIGYPIIFMIVFIPLATTRVLTGMGVSVSIEIVYVSSTLFISNGLFNAIYYGTTRKMFKKWKLEVDGTTTRGKYSKSGSHRTKSRETKSRETNEKPEGSEG